MECFNQCYDVKHSNNEKNAQTEAQLGQLISSTLIQGFNLRFSNLQIQGTSK